MDYSKLIFQYAFITNLEKYYISLLVLVIDPTTVSL